jgi:hypothetical protein
MLIYVTGLGNEGYVCRSVFLLSALKAREMPLNRPTACLDWAGHPAEREAGKPHYKIRIINLKNTVLKAIIFIKKVVESYNGLYRRHALLARFIIAAQSAILEGL